VEIDETFMEKIKNPRNRKGTMKAIGMVQRGGTAKAVAVYNAKLANTIPLIQHEVKQGSNIMTDSSTLYYGNLPDYQHNAVNHGKGEYAFGQIHTNSVEGFFSQIKRSIDGTYHKISSKYLQSYLDEFSWRLTHSRSGIPMFVLLLQRICRLPNGEAGKSVI
jgi:transposase-like protein